MSWTLSTVGGAAVWRNGAREVVARKIPSDGLKLTCTTCNGSAFFHAIKGDFMNWLAQHETCSAPKGKP